MKNFALLIVFIVLCSFINFGNKRADEAINYYGTSDTIHFKKVDYKLSWSSHPSAIYYKHEYLPNGELPEHFNDMVLLEFVQGNFSVKDAVAAQLNFLLERKKTDAVCNYKVMKSANGQEFILDFLMSESSGDKVSLLEWSAYHYKEYTDKAGHKGVLMLGISHRTYGDGSINFLKALSGYRQENIKALSELPFPEIQVK